MEISFRVYTPSDQSDVLDMMAAFNALGAYPFDRGITKQNLEEFTQNPSLGKLFLIQEADKNIGYMVLAFGFSFEYQGRDAFLDEIYLQAGYQGQGIGQLALEHLEKEAKSIDVKALHLEVEMHNTKAHRLYIKQGFKSANRSLMTKRMR